MHFRHDREQYDMTGAMHAILFKLGNHPAHFGESGQRKDVAGKRFSHAAGFYISTD